MYLSIYIFSFGTINFGVFMIRKNIVTVRYLTAPIQIQIIFLQQ